MVAQLNSYTVKFKCTNCSYIFSKTLEKGVTASGRAGECPTCGCDENSVGQNGQKIGVFPIVHDVKHSDPDFDKYEVLLETDGVTVKRKGAEKC